MDETCGGTGVCCRPHCSVCSLVQARLPWAVAWLPCQLPHQSAQHLPWPTWLLMLSGQLLSRPSWRAAWQMPLLCSAALHCPHPQVQACALTPQRNPSACLLDAAGCQRAWSLDAADRIWVNDDRLLWRRSMLTCLSPAFGSAAAASSFSICIHKSGSTSHSKQLHQQGILQGKPRSFRKVPRQILYMLIRQIFCL